MKKEVLLAGLLGGLVIFVWITISNAVLPYKSNMIHKISPNQLEIHKVLKENITEIGTYSIPYLSPQDEVLLPDYRNQPVFSITYDGFTHGSASGLSFFPILIVLVVPTLAAWMLSVTSPKILSHYIRRVLFIVIIGVIISLYDDILQMSLGPQSKNYLLFLAINNFITWVLVGLVIAWRVKIKSTD